MWPAPRIGPEHLDGDGPDLPDRATFLIALIIAQFGLMHLGDRGCGDRIGKGGKDFIDRPPEIGFDNGPRLIGGKRHHVVFEQRQRVGGIGADNVGACRQELAELDIGRPEPVERIGKPPAALTLAQAARLDQSRRPHHPRRARRHGVGVDEAEGA